MPAKLTNKSWISLVKSGVNPTDYLFEAVGPTNCDANGNTLLHYAANFGDYGLCEVLLSEGWFVLHKNSRGESALDYGISYPKVKKLLEAHVRSLPSKVLDYALSSPPIILKQQARSNWQAIASPYPNSRSDGKNQPPEEKFEKFVSEVPVASGEALNSLAHNLADQGYFAPVGATNDPDAADWVLPEELMSEGEKVAFGLNIKLTHSRSELGNEEEIASSRKKLEDSKVSVDLTYRTLSGRVSTILLLVRVFSCILNDRIDINKFEGLLAKRVVTDHDREEYGDSIDVMGRVFDDEVRFFRAQLLDHWDEMRSSLSSEIEGLLKLISTVIAMNFSPRVAARQVITSEEQIDYGESIDVMSRVFAERLSATDIAISALKADLIKEISSLNLEMSGLFDAIHKIKSFSVDDRGSAITQDDIDDYGESIEIMRRICRAELSARVNFLKDLFNILAT